MASLHQEFSDEETEDGSVESRFHRAADYLQLIHKSVDSDKLLLFYGLYKQATIGRCNTPKPGMFNLTAKSKWNAWFDLKHMTKHEAMINYCQEMDKLKPNWDEKSGDGGASQNKPKEQWVSVSTHLSDDGQSLPDSERDLFDCVKVGDVPTFRKLFESDEHDINEIDDTGMHLIHWAADRGNPDILSFLLEHGADINSVDGDGQTALHYAASCGHIDCIRILLRFGADKTITDNESLTSLDVAFDQSTKDLLNN